MCYHILAQEQPQSVNSHTPVIRFAWIVPSDMPRSAISYISAQTSRYGWSVLRSEITASTAGWSLSGRRTPISPLSRPAVGRFGLRSSETLRPETEASDFSEALHAPGASRRWTCSGASAPARIRLSRTRHDRRRTHADEGPRRRVEDGVSDQRTGRLSRFAPFDRKGETPLCCKTNGRLPFSANRGVVEGFFLPLAFGWLRSRQSRTR